jgi:hypothetical protein
VAQEPLQMASIPCPDDPLATPDTPMSLLAVEKP